ncbi:MAG TPA: dolichyl-phosphate beta-glucosyltransferase [Roseiflexaceae bacterium]|nr:dolichyl-phosphate beta-glucosyltransferase [Roseiflexaceae bacterium]
MHISLIIPAYNESQRLAVTVHRYAQALTARCHPSQFEILIVANGCTDNTVEVAEQLAVSLPSLRVIEIPGAVGKGGAVVAGLRQAQGKAVMFTDADGATQADSLLALVAELGQHDLVIGSRRLPESVVVQRQPLKRRMLGTLFAGTVRTCFGLPYRDTQCGAKVFRQRAAHLLAEHIQERRWMFDVDLLLCARQLQLRVAERPVVWEDQPGSKLNCTSTAKEVISAIYRLHRRHGSNAAIIPAQSVDVEVLR